MKLFIGPYVKIAGFLGLISNKEGKKKLERGWCQEYLKETETTSQTRESYAALVHNKKHCVTDVFFTT